MRNLRTIVILLIISCMQSFAGYTHYFTWHQKPNDDELKKCVAEMNQLIEARKGILVSPDLQESVPSALKLGSLKVDFNGVGDDAHEPLVFPGLVGFNFCKTAYKPYDEVVTACLIVARDHFPTSVLSISSDGSWEDWQQGAKLYTSVFHRPARNPFGGNVLNGTNKIPGIDFAIFIAVSLLIISIIVWLVRIHRDF